MTTKIGIGFIGNGKSTNRYHLPFIMQRKDKYSIKTIYSKENTKNNWAKIPYITYTSKLNELLTDPNIQVIVISTPPKFHYEYAKKVIHAGKNCIVEKPFTQTLTEAKELFALAKEKKVMIQCYQNRRFDSDFLTCQKVIESKKLGDLLEIEMHFDYYRPSIPENTKYFSIIDSYLYGHGCHTLDQVISYFGKPDTIHYDVRQLLGKGKMNDYFDIDLYYQKLKISVKSSYFRIKQRPSFVIYGKKGMFIKEKKDKQEEHLKLFYLPNNNDFGIDTLEDYGTLSYYDDMGKYHEEKVISEIGDYGKYYDKLYKSLIYQKEKTVKDHETLLQIQILEEGIKQLD